MHFQEMLDAAGISVIEGNGFFDEQGGIHVAGPFLVTVYFAISIARGVSSWRRSALPMRL